MELKIEEISEKAGMIIGEVEKGIVGKRNVLEKAMASILAGGHILFEDYPGLAKTMMARSLSSALGCTFRRIQFTPDLLPADITGTYVFDRNSGDFKLIKGPIFTNVLLADEINRAPPKTQSALLEAMQEGQTTLEGVTYRLPEPFIVIATQNPIEYEGTYPLPEAQMDRFLIRLEMGYPSKKEEVEILRRRKARKKDNFSADRVIDTATLTDMQKSIEDVHVDDSMRDYMVEIVGMTRKDPQVDVGSSPRGSLALMKLSMAYAAIHGRDYVIPDDVKAIAVEALSHRILLKPGPWIKGVKTTSIISEILKKTPVPKVK